MVPETYGLPATGSGTVSTLVQELPFHRTICSLDLSTAAGTLYVMPRLTRFGSGLMSAPSQLLCARIWNMTLSTRVPPETAGPEAGSILLSVSRVVWLKLE